MSIGSLFEGFKEAISENYMWFSRFGHFRPFDLPIVGLRRSMRTRQSADR